MQDKGNRCHSSMDDTDDSKSVSVSYSKQQMVHWGNSSCGHGGRGIMGRRPVDATDKAAGTVASVAAPSGDGSDSSFTSAVGWAEVGASSGGAGNSSSECFTAASSASASTLNCGLFRRPPPAVSSISSSSSLSSSKKIPLGRRWPVGATGRAAGTAMDGTATGAGDGSDSLFTNAVSWWSLSFSSSSSSSSSASLSSSTITSRPS